MAFNIITGEKEHHGCLVKVAIEDRRTPVNPDAGGWMWDVLFGKYPLSLREEQKESWVHVLPTETAQDGEFIEQATTETFARSLGPVQNRVDPNGFWLERMIYEKAVDRRILAGMTTINLQTGEVVEIAPKDRGK